MDLILGKSAGTFFLQTFCKTIVPLCEILFMASAKIVGLVCMLNADVNPNLLTPHALCIGNPF